MRYRPTARTLYIQVRSPGLSAIVRNNIFMLRKVPYINVPCRYDYRAVSFGLWDDIAVDKFIHQLWTLHFLDNGIRQPEFLRVIWDVF